ncbi:sigma-54 interaction domain-containing protein [Virgibacillus kimchii]
MTNHLPLSLFIIGSDQGILEKVMGWNREGVISLIGMVDPLSDQKSNKENSAGHQIEQWNDQHIDIIVIAGKEKAYQKAAVKLEQEYRLIIGPDTFWFLEKTVQRIEEIQSLTRKQKVFQTILTHSHEGVQFIDSDGIVQFVNPAFSRITNIPPEERLGKHIEDVSPDGSLNKAFKSKTSVLRYTSTSPGSNVETIANAAPIFNGDKFIGAVATFQDVTEVKYLTEKLMEHEQTQKIANRQKSGEYRTRYSLAHIIGESKEVKETLKATKRAARSRSTVLITGESGTGKELLAHAIHTESKFKDKPFVTVNCAAIPENLLESELFGYEKGAFTHAVKQKAGKIELADGGTLFLDEIGDMNLSLQVKMLRVLQDKEFERIGGLKKIHADFRIIAATNADLEKLVSEGKFREDLYYRINVIRLELPPLRKRKEDISLLVQALIKSIGKRIGFSPIQLTDKGLSLLAEHDWPGNIRELENFLERLMNESTSSVIPDHLVEKHLKRALNTSLTRKENVDDTTSLLPLNEVEKNYIKKTLNHFGSTMEGKREAAHSLGISISTLYNKIRSYQLE